MPTRPSTPPRTCGRPGVGHPGLVLAAFPERVDTRDLLVGGRLDSLPTGATVATGSARRRVQLANLRPDLTFAGLRGTWRRGWPSPAPRGGRGGGRQGGRRPVGMDAPDGLETEVLAPQVMLPQVGQGALAVECRIDDTGHPGCARGHRRPGVAALVAAERAFLPSSAAGAHCRWAPMPVGGDGPGAWPGDRAGIGVGVRDGVGPRSPGPGCHVWPAPTGWWCCATPPRVTHPTSWAGGRRATCSTMRAAGTSATGPRSPGARADDRVAGRRRSRRPGPADPAGGPN